MSKDVLLSIVIPFYNVELYIEKCLISIIDQTEMLENIEIICVDDCSPDNSHLIVEKLMLEYDFIKLIRHSVNKKVGGARNTGLMEAQGKYIWFVDSDDYIAPNSLDLLMNTCIANNLDVLAFNIKTVTNDGHVIQKENAFKNFNTEPLNGPQLLDATFGNQLIYNLGYPYRAILKNDLLKNINAVFPENISYGEETTYIARCIVHAKRVMSFSNAYYCYRQNPSSVTNKLEVGFKGELVFQSIVNAGSYVQDLINECEIIDQNTANNLILGMPWFINRLFLRLLKTSYKERNIFFRLCNENQQLISNIAYYGNLYNKFVLKQPKLSGFVISVISPLYQFKKKVIGRK